MQRLVPAFAAVRNSESKNIYQLRQQFGLPAQDRSELDEAALQEEEPSVFVSQVGWPKPQLQRCQGRLLGCAPFERAAQMN